MAMPLTSHNVQLPLQVQILNSLIPVPPQSVPMAVDDAPSRRQPPPPLDRPLQRAATLDRAQPASADAHEPAVPAPSRAAEESVSSTPPSVSPSRLQLDDMLASARRDAGKIDRELRQTAPVRPGLMSGWETSAGTRLARDIAAAGVDKGTAMYEVVLGDGRRYTRVESASGTYCVWSRDARPSAVTGTVFDTMVRTSNCPK